MRIATQRIGSAWRPQRSADSRSLGAAAVSASLLLVPTLCDEATSMPSATIRVAGEPADFFGPSRPTRTTTPTRRRTDTRDHRRTAHGPLAPVGDNESRPPDVQSACATRGAASTDSATPPGRATPRSRPPPTAAPSSESLGGTSSGRKRSTPSHLGRHDSHEVVRWIGSPLYSAQLKWWAWRLALGARRRGVGSSRARSPHRGVRAGAKISSHFVTWVRWCSSISA